MVSKGMMGRTDRVRNVQRGYGRERIKSLFEHET
jgi:hypothetical protein